MKPINIIIGFVVILYMIYAPIYIIFFNSSKDAAESLSAVSSIKTALKIAKDEHQIDNKIYDIVTSQINDFVTYCNKNNIDISIPLKKFLEKEKDVSNIRISEGSQNLTNFLNRNGISDKSEISVYTLSWNKDNNTISLPILVINPSFLKFRTAKALAMNYEIILQSYNITSEHMLHMPDELKNMLMLLTMIK